MSISSPILVLGGTGRQGGATARELLRRGHAVRVLVRDRQAVAARALGARGAELVLGDLDDGVSLRSAMRDAHGVFSVQTFRGAGGVVAEERQGKAVADAAAACGVAHVVYSSVGGVERLSGIPHFESKWRIEEYLNELGLPVTVLRPAMFYEMFHDIAPRPANDRAMLGLWVRPEVPIQMIGVDDIGAFAADAFEQPEFWLGRRLEIAADELTGPQLAEAFARVTGVDTYYRGLPIDGLRAARADLAAMFEWLDRDGYHADLPELRRLRPDLRRFASWLLEVWLPAHG